IQGKDPSGDAPERAPVDAFGTDLESSPLRLERHGDGSRAACDDRRENGPLRVIGKWRQVIPAVRPDDRVKLKISRKWNMQAHAELSVLSCQFSVLTG